MTPVAWWVILRLNPPERASIGDVSAIDRELRELGPLRAAEWKLIAILTAMLGLWIASTWQPTLDVALVALCGALVMFLPGLGLLRWKDVERATGWDTLLVILGVSSIGVASVETGLAKWMVERSMGGIEAWSPVWIVAAVSAFTVVVHLVLPIGPVVSATLIPPIALLATSTGQSPVLYALPVAFTASCAFLLPLDPVPLLTYTKGYYRMTEMLRPGAVLSAIWVAVITLLMLVVAPAVGLL
jgi:sodium-dependent dicarboxylate transporter 2/3/5